MTIRFHLQASNTGLGGKNETPPIIFSKPPRTNILATSSDAWFIESLNEADSAGGFIPRWLILQMPDLGRCIPTPLRADGRLVDPLAARLKQIKDLKGSMDFSKVQSIYDAWYRETRKEFDQQPNQRLAMAFWNRHRAHFLKLAAVFNLSGYASLEVQPESMTRAMEFTEQIRRTLFDLLPTGMGREGAGVKQVENAILQRGADGMLQCEFTKAFQGWPSMMREQRLRTLVDGGTIIRYGRPTQGRQGNCPGSPELLD